MPQLLIILDLSASKACQHTVYLFELFRLCYLAPKKHRILFSSVLMYLTLALTFNFFTLWITLRISVLLLTIAPLSIGGNEQMRSPYSALTLTLNQMICGMTQTCGARFSYKSAYYSPRWIFRNLYSPIPWLPREVTRIYSKNSTPSLCQRVSLRYLVPPRRALELF